MNAAAAAELERQQGYQKRASSTFQESLGQSTPEAAQRQIGQGSEQALREYQTLANAPLSVSAASQNVAPTQNSTVDTARNQQYDKMMGGLNAANQGYGNYTLQQYLKNLQAGSQLGIIGSEAQASSGVLPLELQDASQSWSGLQGIGSLLQAAGGLMGLYGAVNPSLAGANAAAESAAAGGAAGAQTFGGGFLMPGAFRMPMTMPMF
jgi:hypothetical protein